jgi:hypothetical protein
LQQQQQQGENVLCSLLPTCQYLQCGVGARSKRRRRRTTPLQTFLPLQRIN